MNSKTSTIIGAALFAGTLDILSAFILYFIKSGRTNVLIILNYIASGLFGKEAFTGGGAMMLAGILLHYFIAFVFTVFFFWLFPRIQVMKKNKIVTGILYGIFVWLVMNLMVVPLSAIGKLPTDIMNALINAVILIVCIGLPLSFMASHFFKKHPSGY